MTEPNQDYGVDPELLRGFLDEAAESLASLDPLFVQLESSHDLQIIQAIFRPVHSLKGNAAFFGLTQVRQVAHDLETVLDLARKGRREIDRAATDVLLAGFDALRQMIGRIRSGGPEIDDQARLQLLLDRIRQLAVVGPATAIATAIAATSPAIRSSVPVEDPFLALVGQLPPTGDDLTQEMADHLMSRLAALGSRAVDDAATGALAEILDTARAILDSLGPSAVLGDLIREQVPELRSHGVWRTSAEVAGGSLADGLTDDGLGEIRPTTALVERPAEDRSRVPSSRYEQAKDRPDEKSMRVPETQIDTFLAYVGDLLVVGDMFGHLERRLADGTALPQVLAELRRANTTFAALSDNLQRSIMALRKVQARTLLQKVPRLVRDIAAITGKDIGIEVVGNDTGIDKSLVELLDAPLVHLVRNAADHGIEPPAQRLARGKPAQGTVRVSIIESDTAIVLTVADDGAGLNLDRIRLKAIELGLIQGDDQLGEKELVDCIFASGVSTASEITDISGRGVGLDVVKRTIEEAGGSISIETVAGTGCTFTVSLPKGVTTQILAGYLVSCAGQVYVLPLDRIQRTLQIPATGVSTLVGGQRTVILQGGVVPLVVLREILGQTMDAGTSPDPLLVVTLSTRDRTIAVAVDEVVGVQQVVVRQIEGGMSIGPAVAGGALMGNGTVAVVLDVERMLGG